MGQCDQQAGHGSSLSLSGYYGSGAFSSPIVSPVDPDVALDSGKRQGRTELNFWIVAL